MDARVGVIGLGIMGSAYAGHLIDAGFHTSGFDVLAESLGRFEARGGKAAGSPQELAQECDVILTALASTEALEAAFFGSDGVAAGARSGTVVIEAGTFGLDVKERVRAGMAAVGVAVLDAPVSGTGSQAQARDLTLFASGERTAFNAVLPVLEAYARDVRYVGDFGNGSKLKYIANLLVTIHNLSTAEAVVLAQKSGIDPSMMLDVLGDSAASSRMLTVRGPMMVQGCYEPATMKLDVYQKDIDIIAAFAKSVDCPTPLFTHSAPFYAAALAEGRSKQDTAAIASILKAMAGLPADP